MTRITSSRAHLITSNPVFRAMRRNPIALNKWARLSVDARMAFARFELGTQQDADKTELACPLEIAQWLAREHCTPDDRASVQAAMQAMQRADAREAQGLAWNFDGPGRDEMKRALEIYDALISALPRIALTDALMALRNKREAS